MDELSIGNAASHVCGIACAGPSGRWTGAGVSPAAPVRRFTDAPDLDPAGVRSALRSEAAAGANAWCVAGHVRWVRPTTADAVDPDRPQTEARAGSLLRRIVHKKDEVFASLGDPVQQPEGLAADAYPAGGGHG